MSALIILLFILGYITIVLEHPLKLDKTVPALMMAALMWAAMAIGFNNGWLSIIDGHDHVYSMTELESAEEGHEVFANTLLHHLGKVAEILIFLIVVI